MAATPASTTTAAATTTATTATTAATSSATSTACASAAAAANLEVGVADDEAATHQAVHIVNLRAFDQRGALRVDKDLHAGCVNYKVVSLRFAFHAEHVLEAAVWSGHDHHSQQSARLTLLVQYLFKLLRSHVGNLDKRSCCHRYTSGR